MKPSSFALFVVSLLVAVPSLSRAGETTREDLEKILPPALVECHTPATCDRDPKHLEAFVVSFYAWYVANTRLFRFDLGGQYIKNEEHVLKERLSPKFFALNRKAMQGHDGEKGAPFCLDTDSFPLLCTLYPPDAWLGEISAHLKEMDQDTCWILVFLPESALFPTTRPARNLAVRLKVARGAWRIDRVTDLPLQLHNDISHTPPPQSSR